MKSKNTTPNISLFEDAYKDCYDNYDQVTSDGNSCLKGVKSEKYTDQCKDFINNQNTLDLYFGEDLNYSYSTESNFDKLKSMENNLSFFIKKGELCVKQFKVCCPSCDSKHIIENGYYDRDLIIDTPGFDKLRVKRYICKHCGNDFSADISSIVRPYATVSNSVKDIVFYFYSTAGISVRDIQELLNLLVDVEISHQEVQDILVSYNEGYKSELKKYSGYYIFDSLWVKVDELKNKYSFLLVLFDSEYNTVVSYKLVENESEKEIYEFLRSATRNQPCKAITTDLKREYRKPINQLGCKHQFCEFHSKQNINKYIDDYNTENQLPEEKIKEYNEYKKELNEIFNSNTRTEVNNTIDKLITKAKDFPEIIQKVLWKKIIPYSKNLTQFVDDDKIKNTSNLIEGFFGKVLPKYIKNNYKTLDGLLKRFSLRLKRWDERNALF
ncbi:MAG: hypothetical protein Q4E75_07090 [bacterium]|nr:hypothetical protein [bacterium]